MSTYNRVFGKLMILGIAAAITAYWATKPLSATDDDGPICKIHPTSQICNQPFTEGCDCVTE